MDPQELEDRIVAIQKRLRRVAVAVFVMALALLLCAAAIFGQLVNYFAGDPLLYGGATAGAAVTGFIFGWFAKRAG